MEEKDEIGKLLEEYRRQKTQRESGAESRKPKEIIDFAAPPVEPPKPAVKEEPTPVSEEPVTDELEPITEELPPPMPLQPQEITPEEITALKSEEEEPKEKKKSTFAENAKSFKKVFKTAAAAVVAILVIAGVCFGVKYALNASKDAYLKPYESKYGISFPSGMLKEYCDLYGENQNTTGYIKIGDISLDSPVYEENSGYPCVKTCRADCRLNNYVVYLDTKELEKHYSTAEAYNDSEQYIEYSNLFSNFRYKVIGAFYTNTKPEDDNGYVFPYATPETMTAESAGTFVTDLQTRFIYSTGDSFSRKDRLLIISCPTDFRDGFEFVVVCKLTDGTEMSTARENDADRIHYPQVVFDDRKKDNPYKYAHGWYPEIVTVVGTDENGEDVTKPLQLTAEDY